MPLAPFPGRHGWGYDGVAPVRRARAVRRPGRRCKRFVDACHARGSAVCLDVVYNHLGPDGNYLGEFGPYFTDTLRHAVGPGGQPRRRRQPTRCARWVLDNALMWLRDYHVDGLRLDAVHALHDDRAAAPARGAVARGGRARRGARPAAVR